MTWFKRKSKEEKIQDLRKEVDILKEKYKDEIGSYCKIGNYIFILKGFKHDNKNVCVKFIDKDTVEGYTNFLDIGWWGLKYENIEFDKMKYQFVLFKRDLEKIGLKLERLEK